MQQWLVALLSGAVFGVGLALSGMTQPAKVIGFLDVTGDWDASLALVMGGAIAVYAPIYHFVFAPRRSASELAALAPPPRAPIDAPLLMGAAIFGIGWGIGGFCPGPALTALGSGAQPTIVFVIAMLAGMLIHAALFGKGASRGQLVAERGLDLERVSDGRPR